MLLLHCLHIRICQLSALSKADSKPAGDISSHLTVNSGVNEAHDLAPFAPPDWCTRAGVRGTL